MNKYAAFGIVGIIVLLSVASRLSLSHAASPPPASAPMQEQGHYWKARIQKVGAAAAYEEFGVFVQTLVATKQHTEAHIFGGALFDATGVSGLTACDTRYNAGCFHEFLGRAISVLGLSSLTQLEEMCQQAPSRTIVPCEHGLGHGILANLGYSEENLEQALATCTAIHSIDAFSGCKAGVLMEYNLHTLLGDDGHSRPDAGDLQFPCDVLPDQYKISCYAAQAQWWSAKVPLTGVRDIDAIYKKIGELCNQVPAQYVLLCVAGLGNTNVMYDANFEGTRARELCEDVSDDPLQQLACKALASHAIALNGGDKRSTAPLVCAALTGQALATCTEYEKNPGRIVLPLVLPSHL